MDCPDCFHLTRIHGPDGCNGHVPVNAFPITSLPCSCPLDHEGKRQPRPTPITDVES